MNLYRNNKSFTQGEKEVREHHLNGKRVENLKRLLVNKLMQELP